MLNTTRKYLVAWHPKASTENERTSVVIENKKATVLFRQIAGALAKRIVMYSKKVMKQYKEKILDSLNLDLV